MKTQHQINTARNLSKVISSVSSVSVYLKEKKKRKVLADTLKQVIVLGSSYPPKIASMTNHTATQLYRRVSDTCPACVSTLNMTKYIKLALRDLKTYNTHLVEWIGDSFAEEKPKSVHELRPTKK